jgi:hypothetical protein
MRINSAPMEISRTPMRIAETPMEISDTPIFITVMLMRIGDPSMGIGATPTDIGKAPLGIGDAPMEISDPPIFIARMLTRIGGPLLPIGGALLGIGAPLMRVSETLIEIGDPPLSITMALMRVAGPPIRIGDTFIHPGAPPTLSLSLPLRLYLERGCGPIPSAGGPCNATVRIVNGLPTRLQAEAWSVVQANRNDFGTTSLTTFQAGSPRAVSLNPGASMTLPFDFTVPAGVEDGTTICGQTVVAPRTNRFETFGTRHLFCLSKGVQGFAAVPEAQKHDAVRKLLGQTAPAGKP